MNLEDLSTETFRTDGEIAKAELCPSNSFLIAYFKKGDKRVYLKKVANTDDADKNLVSE